MTFCCVFPRDSTSEFYQQRAAEPLTFLSSIWKFFLHLFKEPSFLNECLWNPCLISFLNCIMLGCYCFSQLLSLSNQSIFNDVIKDLLSLIWITKTHYFTKVALTSASAAGAQLLRPHQLCKVIIKSSGT